MDRRFRGVIWGTDSELVSGEPQMPLVKIGGFMPETCGI
jgi:hypothetical protein